MSVEKHEPGATADRPAESDEHAPACPASKVEWLALIAGASHSLVSQALVATLPEFSASAAETLSCPLDVPGPAARHLYLSLLNFRI